MKSLFLFTILFLIGSIQVTAGTHTLISTAPCLACNIPDGLAASDLTGTSATLSWNAVSGATQYTVEVQDEQNNPGTFQVETNVIGTSYAVTGLQAGVSYKFKVRTRCGSDKSDWSEWVFFTAGSGSGGGGGTSGCGVVTGLSATATGGTASLTWNAVSGASKYTIEVEDEQNSPSIFHLEDSTLTNTYTLSGLQTGVLYKFKVRTHCSGGQSDWSAWMFFNSNGNGGIGGTTGACTVPAMLAVTVDGTSAKLSWNNVSGATQYYVEVEDEQNVPSNFKLEISVQDSFYTVTGLQAGVLYKFKVSTYCSGGQSVWSNWMFFNGTGSGGNGGGTTGCIVPTGQLITDISASSAILNWNAVPGAASYTLEIERTQQGASTWKITQVVTTNSFLLTGLNPDTRYKFKVRSNCTGGGNSDWTQWRKFKTTLDVSGTVSQGNFSPATEDRDAVSDAATSTLEMQVYPNPIHTSTTVRLQIPGAESIALSLFDLTGHLMRQQHIQQDGGDWEGTLSFGDLPNGMYLLQARTPQNTKTLKLTVSH
jgi:hypothetical protein